VTILLWICLLPASCWFLAWHILWLWRRRRHDPPKGRLTFKELHGVIYQEIELFVTTTVKTSNPVYQSFYANILWFLFYLMMCWSSEVFTVSVVYEWRTGKILYWPFPMRLMKFQETRVRNLVSRFDTRAYCVCVGVRG
jgi:hypothetical protein